jgi:hypothetical protein
VWFDYHALTLKRNTAKYYFGKKSIFAYLPKNLLQTKEVSTLAGLNYHNYVKKQRENLYD